MLNLNVGLTNQRLLFCFMVIQYCAFVFFQGVNDQTVFYDSPMCSPDENELIEIRPPLHPSSVETFSDKHPSPQLNMLNGIQWALRRVQ